MCCVCLQKHFRSCQFHYEKRVGSGERWRWVARFLKNGSHWLCWRYPENKTKSSGKLGTSLQQTLLWKIDAFPNLDFWRMGHIDFVDFIHLFIFNGSFCYSFFCLLPFFVFSCLALLSFVVWLFYIFCLYCYFVFFFIYIWLFYLFWSRSFISFYIILHWLFFILFCIFIFSCNSSFISRNIGLLVGRTVNLSVTSF